MADDNKKPLTFTRGSNVPEPSRIPSMPKNVQPPKANESQNKKGS